MPEESLEYRLSSARHVVWRNLPNGAVTFNNCHRCTRGQRARGDGVCLLCAEDDLAALIGREEAQRYVQGAREIRQLESTHLDLAHALEA